MKIPVGSVEKNLPANAGDAGSIPGSGRFPEEGNGNPLQYSSVKNLPAMQETRVRFLGLEDPLEKG